MGHVISLLEQHHGLTREQIVQACTENDLHGGSIDRMILYAKNCKLLLPDGATLPVKVVDHGPASPLAQSSMNPSDQTNGDSLHNGAEHIEMSACALVFLADPLARQLAVGWTYCQGNVDTWMALSGIKPCFRVEAKELCIALRGSGICRDGGVTDTLALRYITTMATEPFLKRGRHRDKSDK